MIQKGACNIIVIGRSNLTDANQKFIHEWQKQKIKIQYIQADVSDLENLKSKFRSFESSTIRGVFHTAALLNDKLLQTHDLESFESIFPGKVQGAWNLHQLSKLWHLDHFVFFSSTVSLLGNIGQTNYAAANYFLNSLASFRQHQQLPALSICWGPWKSSKMTKGMDQKFEEMGIFPFSTDTGFDALERALTQKNTSGLLAAIQVQPDLLVNNRSIWLHSLFPAEWQLKTRAVIPKSAMTIFNTADQALIMLEELAREVLKLEPDDSLNTERPYFEIGFDSIMLNMLQTKVLQTTGINISITQFFKHPSLIALAAYLKEFSSPELAPVNAATHSDSTLTISEELRKEVSKLSDDDITALLNKY
ncbi:MAG: ketoreductase and phosphopantetheine attachment site domain-containing protein, partial [Haliscomenobacter sp.]|nr:ketoreductase and phosphopantetheine attachment site domain-containing protein [Haliscomenobacter sp.]